MSKTHAKITRDAENRPPKNPRVPVFPPAAQATAQKLLEIIDGGDVMATTAYAAYCRLCVMWVPGALTSDASNLGGGQMGQVVNDLIGLMAILFPGGDGLPDADGSP